MLVTRFRKSFLTLLAAGACVGLSVRAAAAAEPSRPLDLAALHALIKPQAAEENWTRIPWLTSLWEARQKAAAEGKPILLWEMDGHPLGCT
jgi:hypothetical protein